MTGYRLGEEDKLIVALISTEIESITQKKAENYQPYCALNSCVKLRQCTFSYSQKSSDLWRGFDKKTTNSHFNKSFSMFYFSMCQVPAVGTSFFPYAKSLVNVWICCFYVKGGKSHSIPILCKISRHTGVIPKIHFYILLYSKTPKM